MNTNKINNIMNTLYYIKISRIYIIVYLLYKVYKYYIIKLLYSFSYDRKCYSIGQYSYHSYCNIINYIENKQRMFDVY